VDYRWFLITKGKKIKLYEPLSEIEGPKDRQKKKPSRDITRGRIDAPERDRLMSASGRTGKRRGNPNSTCLRHGRKKKKKSDGGLISPSVGEGQSPPPKKRKERTGIPLIVSDEKKD